MIACLGGDGGKRQCEDSERMEMEMEMREYDECGMKEL